MSDDHALGGFLANLLGADDTAEGPPYTHIVRSPEPAPEHVEPHFDEGGLCRCGCGDCMTPPGRRTC